MTGNFKIDTVNIPPEYDTYHITRYFLETYGKHKSALGWMQTLNTYTLELIVKIAQRDISYCDPDDPNAYDTEIEDIEELELTDPEIDEGTDIYILAYFIEEMELESPINPSCEDIEYVMSCPINQTIARMKNMYIIALFECYRRYDIANITGDGKMTGKGDNVNMKITCSAEEFVDFVLKTGIGSWMLDM